MKNLTFFPYLQEKIESFVENMLQNIDFWLIRLAKKLRYSWLFFSLLSLLYFIVLGINIHKSSWDNISLNFMFLVTLLVVYEYYSFSIFKWVQTHNTIDKSSSDLGISNLDDPLKDSFFVFRILIYIFACIDFCSSFTSSSEAYNNSKYTSIIRGKLKCGIIIFCILGLLFLHYFYCDFQKIFLVPFILFFVLEPILFIFILFSAFLFLWSPLTGIALAGGFLYLWHQDIMEMLRPSTNKRMSIFPIFLSEKSGFTEIFESVKDEILDKLLEEKFPAAKYDIFENSCELMNELVENNYQPFLPVKKWLDEKEMDSGTVVEFGSILIRNYFLKKFPKMKYARDFIRTKKGFIPKFYIKPSA